jgi:hypothetical protein
MAALSGVVKGIVDVLEFGSVRRMWDDFFAEAGHAVLGELGDHVENPGVVGIAGGRGGESGKGE